MLKKSKSHVELFLIFSQKKIYDFLESFGSLPLPPYIKSFNSKEQNEKNYQSIFSRRLGAFASPTAACTLMIYC